MEYSDRMEQNAPIIEDNPLDPRALRQYRVAARRRLATHWRLQAAVALLLCATAGGAVYVVDHMVFDALVVGLLVGIGFAGPATLLLLRVWSR